MVVWEAKGITNKQKSGIFANIFKLTWSVENKIMGLKIIELKHITLVYNSEKQRQ